VPMYFVKRGDIYHDVAGGSFRDLIDGRLAELPGEHATLSDWKNHLSTIFPEVRLKHYIEMRGTDAGPGRGICALPAFWVGLLYDSVALDAAWEIVKGWTEEERQALRIAVPRTALNTPFRGGMVLDLARELVALAHQGLVRRGFPGEEQKDETAFLAPLEEIVESGVTPAERLLREFETEWNGDINEVFRRYAY